MLKNILRSVLIAVSYYSVKKTIEKLPQPYQKAAVLILRSSVFFVLMLLLFSLLSGRVDSISNNIENFPRILNSFLMTLAFIVSTLFSLLLTAVVEEIYRKISQVHESAKEKAEGIKKAQRDSSDAVKKSIDNTRNIAGASVKAVAECAQSIYSSASKLTGATVDKADDLIRKVLRKKGK